MAKRTNLKGIKLGRTVGVEVEGYTGMYRTMVNRGVRHSSTKYDGSLTGGSRNTQGIEVVTKPINDLDLLDEVFEDITSFQWNVGRGTAGTHVHVDARDYKLEDRIKMAVFMNLIEKAMFLMVKKSRWSRTSYGSRNQYCRPVDGGWKQMLHTLNNEYASFNWKQYKNIGELQYAVIEKQRSNNQPYRHLRTPNTTRYQFVNIWSSSHPTIEFRIFHAIRSANDAKKFALIAYNLVELVKHSTLEHLEYLADVIMNKSTDANDMIVKFAEAIGLSFIPKINNTDLASSVNYDKRRANQQRTVSSASTVFRAV